MGAILRSPGAPPWNFRCRGAMLAIEESLMIDGHGQSARRCSWSIVGEVSGHRRRHRLAVPPLELNDEGLDMTDLVPVTPGADFAFRQDRP